MDRACPVRPAAAHRRGRTLSSWGAAGLPDLREGHTKAQSLTSSPCNGGRCTRIASLLSIKCHVDDALAICLTRLCDGWSLLRVLLGRDQPAFAVRGQHHAG